MKQEIERMLEAVRQLEAGWGETARGQEAGGTPALHCATQELRKVLESEAAQPEVNPGRVMAALSGWLAETQVPGVRCQVSGEEQDSGQERAQEGTMERAKRHIDVVSEQVKELRQQIGEAERRQRIAENRLRVNGKLAASRLPKPLADLVARGGRP